MWLKTLAFNQTRISKPFISIPFLLFFTMFLSSVKGGVQTRAIVLWRLWHSQLSTVIISVLQLTFPVMRLQMTFALSSNTVKVMNPSIFAVHYKPRFLFCSTVNLAAIYHLYT